MNPQAVAASITQPPGRFRVRQWRMVSVCLVLVHPHRVRVEAQQPGRPSSGEPRRALEHPSMEVLVMGTLDEATSTIKATTIAAGSAD